MKKAITILLAFLLATAMIFSLAACNDKCKDGEHQYIDEILKQATCTEKGSKIQRCTVCGDTTEAQDIPTLEHSYSYTPVAGEQKHTKRCTVGGETTTENCTFENGACKFCKATQTPDGGGGQGGGQGGTGGAVTVNVYIHLPTGWNADNLKAYAWYVDSGDHSLLGDWPGTAATSDGDGWYKASFEVVDEAAIQNSNVKFIFNDVVGTNEKKTGDILVVGTDNYVAAFADASIAYSTKDAALASETNAPEQSASVYFVTGSINGWKTTTSNWNYVIQNGQTVTLTLGANDAFKVKQNLDNWDVALGYDDISSVTSDTVDGVSKEGLFTRGEGMDGNNIICNRACTLLVGLDSNGKITIVVVS